MRKSSRTLKNYNPPAGAYPAKGNNMFVYKYTGAGWTVGFYNPQGDFEEETNYLEQEEAAKRAHYLNGGNLEQHKRKVALFKDIWDNSLGTFIQYSTNHVEYEAGPGNYPVAIIEKDDGTVEAYDLAQIKFIEENENEQRTDR